MGDRQELLLSNEDVLLIQGKETNDTPRSHSFRKALIVSVGALGFLTIGFVLALALVRHNDAFLGEQSCRIGRLDH